MALSGFRAALSRAMPDPASALRRLKPGDLRAGEPLPFDLYDGTGRRLAQAGVVIADEAQLERLFTRGIHCDAERFAALADLASQAPPAPGAPAMGRPRVSTVRPWRLLHALRDGLEDALPRIAGGGGEAASALEVVRQAGGELQRLCALDPDALLAVPLLLEGGRYGTRHGIATAVLVEFVLARLDAPPSERRSAVLAALTMNVGMFDLQESLYAQSGGLSPAQRQGVLAHPTLGVALLRQAGVDDPLWLTIVGQHHEHLDGTGYPAQPDASALRLSSQTLMVADRWCAMVAPRTYRHGAPPDQALTLLLGRLGRQADPRLGRMLSEVVGPTPPGTPVKLASGEHGLVFRRSRTPGAPVVLAFRSAIGAVHPDGVRRATDEARLRIEHCLRRDEIGCPIDPEALWEAVEVREPDPPAPG
ncbi:MAG: hypothetical protein EHM87_06070 [Burkholderiales bacterium]|nr:MAG: hypothetical protein EHM87_06070 [Burkholderiales bacterium]